MWSAILLFFVVVSFAGEKVGVSSTKFGHEPGAYNVPNLVPFESSEMTYAPTSNRSQPNTWYQDGMTVVVVNDTNTCFSGNTCIKTIGRDKQWKAVFYRVSYDLLEPGNTYLFNVFIKLVNSSQDVILIATLSRQWYKDPSQHNGRQTFYNFYGRSFYKVEDQWLFFSSNLQVTQQDKDDFLYVDFFLKVSSDTDYILDAASLTKIVYPDWKVQANNNIAYHRMGNIVLNLNVSSHLDPAKITVQVKQTRRHFPFGVAVKAAVIGGNGSDPYVQRYRSWVENRATWVVFINAAKWRGMEFARRDDTDKKFEIVDRALDWLESKNIKARGHAIHWNKLLSTPSWVARSYDKKAEIDRRTNYVVQHYRGRFQHWDVCNEFTVSRLYQDWLNREDILEYLFRNVRRIDPTVKLFTNEWGNLHSHYHFAQTVNAILRLKKQGLIDAIGLQSHFYPDGDTLDMEKIKRHLEIFTNLGLPVWITELTVSHHDPVIRANLLADSLTLFYGTPGVHGILLWDFAPEADNEEMLPCALASPDVTNNAAGDKYDEMLASWTTNTDLGTSSLSTRAFYGNYDITVFYDGVEHARLNNTALTPDHDVIQLKCDIDISVSFTEQ